jgi:outer membrane receptor protein involved in Fe transport
MANFIGEPHNQASVRARALKGVALSAIAMAVVAPGHAQAQQSGDVQEVTITGSRIKAPNLTSDSPVTAVNAEEIKQQGTTNIESLLNNLPAVTADLGNQGYDQGGVANVDLRGLGAIRTLVLIDGQRIGPSSASNPAPDLNFIPAAMVKSVDVLTGGASAVYGSDAIAGVVNFHLLNNFEGAMYDTTFSGYQHDNNNPIQSVLANGVFGTTAYPNPGTVKFDKGAQWDGFIRDNTGIIGVNAPNNKGNITMWAEYRATTPVVGPQRDTSACAVTLTTSAPGKTCGGSGTGVYGHVKVPASLLALNGLPAGTAFADNPNGTKTFVKYTGADYFNFASTSYEQSQDDRTSLGATGHYQIASWAEIYANLMFLHDQNLSQIGPDPIQNQAAEGFTSITVPCSTLGSAPSTDPKLKGLSQQQLLGCNGSTGNSQSFTVPYLREQQGRQTAIDTYRYRAVAGLRGDISEAWSYDASVNLFKTQRIGTDLNYPGLTQVENAFQTGALSWNQYDPSLQAQQEAALQEIGISTDRTSDYDLVASVSGDLGDYGATSPLAKNGAALVLGLEYRRSEVSRNPDTSFATGQLLGTGPIIGFSGAEASREIFGEFRAPLIEDKPFVKALDLNLSFRHTETDVENSGNNFSANTWKISADWAPDDQIRFRGGFNKADRAPNTYELFNPYQPFGGLGGGQDPCAIGGSASLATCSNPALPAGARVTAAQYGTFNSCNAGQCNLNIGGNTALKPEKAETWTWGINLTPDFVPGLTASVDYWDIKVDDYIGVIPAASILTGCYTGQTSYCQFIHRGSDGDLDVTGSIDNNLYNVDSLHTTGVDFDLGYHRSLDDLGLNGAGAITMSLVGTYELTNVTQIVDSLKAYDCAGYFGSNCMVPAPTWRHTARVTWTAPWGQDLSLAWRYIGGVKYDANSPSQPNYNGGGAAYDSVDAKIPAFSYFDLSTSYTLWDKYTVRVGVNNLMDKDPPVLAFISDTILGAAGTTMNAYSTYDTLGRQIFMNFNAKF